MMNSMRPLAGRVALVTGAGPGLGRALARALAEAGANLVVCDINEASLAAARAAVEEAGAECLTVRCDVSDSAAVQRMFAQAAERFGTVHILVNNAALTPNRQGRRCAAQSPLHVPHDARAAAVAGVHQQHHR